MGGEEFESCVNPEGYKAKIDQMERHVSTYASQNAQEWFAECFAEYITSTNPRPVAAKFGELLEKELKKL